jgi:alkanesulfonate monooxygenase SsuD/methylene tetrahydromethanopterin reductase-like flavin-dependent oxidoreductase (luciferase family)
MRVDVHYYGGVPMTDAGAGPPAPTDRRYGNDAVVAGYDNLVHWARTADRLGYHTMWLTEHHFQYEGYEVTPNLVLFGVHLAGVTERLHAGQMFNVVPQWHPLRLAEDIAMADILTGGRMEVGIGRGTVPREARSLGSVVASGDNDMSRADNETNWELFAEGLEVMRLAWRNERFSFSGKHFAFPPPGIPDRGSTVTELTLVPRPTRDIPLIMPISPGRTAEFAAAHDVGGVVALGSPSATKRLWDSYAEAAERHGRTLAPGEQRVLNIHVHVARTRERAVAQARPGHDEFCKFLSPYGRFRAYLRPGETAPRPFTFRPTLEESMELRVMAIGSVDDVVDTLGEYRELLDLRHLVLFPDLPGHTRESMDAQLHLVAEEVLPRLGVTLPGAP